MYFLKKITKKYLTFRKLYGIIKIDMEEIMDCFKDRITELLRTRGVMQKDLAELIGVTESTLSRYMSGERKPDLKTLSNMATALHTTTDYLLGRETEFDVSNVQRLLARNATTMTKEQKMDIIKALLSENVQSDIPDNL